MLKGKTLLAYAAGIIDGEGAIMIATCKQYKLRVQVGMTEEWVPRFLQLNFGGSVCHEKGAPGCPWKDLWVLCANQAQRFLEDILGYLQIKHPQAELAINFQRNLGKPRKQLTEEVLAVREAQAILMSKMNKRGRKPELVLL